MTEAPSIAVKAAFSAAAPYFAAAAAFALALWLAAILRQSRVFSSCAARFARLGPAGRLAVLAVVVLFTLWGGTKGTDRTGGDRDPGRAPGATPARRGSGVQPGALAVTSFSVDRHAGSAEFGLSWTDSFFDGAQSRDIYLLFSTNLLERQWTGLGTVEAPPGTNAFTFAVASNSFPQAGPRPLSFDAGPAGFFRFAADFDSDSDGIPDAVESHCTLTDPCDADTDCDGIPDGWEIANGSCPDNPLDAFSDPDGNGLSNLEDYLGGQPDAGSGSAASSILPDGCLPDGVQFASNITCGAVFDARVSIAEPYPPGFSVYGVAAPGGMARTADMACSGGSPVFSNAISVAASGPCLNVASPGYFILEVSADDNATVSVGTLSASASWPSASSVAVTGILERGSHPVSISWDSIGGPYKFDYAIHFSGEATVSDGSALTPEPPPYPEEDDDCPCGCDYASRAGVASVAFAQKFGRTPGVPSLPSGTLRIRERNFPGRLPSHACLFYDHPMERRVEKRSGLDATIRTPSGEAVAYSGGKPCLWSSGLDCGVSTNSSGLLVEQLPDRTLVTYGADGVPVSLKPEFCREIPVSELGISVSRDASGAISQIQSVSGGTLSVSSAQDSFTVTWSSPSGAPVKSFAFSFDPQGSFTLTEHGNRDYVSRWEHAGGAWTFIKAPGAADELRESCQTRWNGSERSWTRIRTHFRADGSAESTETNVYDTAGHVPRLVLKTANGQTTYSSVASPAGRISAETNETGLAVRRIHDRYGRLAASRRTVKGGMEELTLLSYPQSDGLPDRRPRSMIRFLDGVETERARYACEPGRATVSRTVRGVARTSFTEYDSLGRRILSVSEDGTALRAAYSSDDPAGACTETSETGVFEGGAFSLVDGKSERTVSERNALGDEVGTERFALAGGEWHSLSFETKTYNAKHQVVSTRHSNGKSSSAAWICTGPLWRNGADGIAATNVYDGTKSLVSSTRYSPLGAVTTEYVRDCRGRAVLETESAPGVETRTASRTYDARGRVVSVIDAQGRTTVYAYSADNRTTTETLPSGATRITTVNPDGSLASVTGTAQAAEFYTYGVTEDGLEWTQVNYLSPDGARWRRTYANGFGETVREEWPGFGDAPAIMRRDTEYDALGRLVRVEETGKPVETRKHDCFGEVTNVTFSVGRVVPNAPPETRTVATDWHFAVGRDDPIAPFSNEIWRVSSRTVSCSDSSIAPLVATDMTQVSGLSLANESRKVSIDVRGNASETWSEFDPAKATRISRSRIPTAENVAVEETVDGATVRAVSHSAVTNTASYDAYRRETVRIDGRGNATTNAYDSLGRLKSVTDPPGATTSYAYDAIGNLVAITNALGNATIYGYDIRGNKTYEGGATYPVRYAYDGFNAMTNMTTYRAESLQSGDTTTWLYDEATGLLTNKVYADGKGPAYTYTPDGKLATRTWARGIVTGYSYDGWGNLTNTVYSDNTPTITLVCDVLGRQTEARDAAGVTTFLYDSFGSITNETVVGATGTNTIIRYWDGFGRSLGYSLAGRVVPNAPQRQTTLSYDPVTGRLATMLADGSESPFAWSYHPGSDLKSSLAYPNGLTAFWAYDANSQLLQVRNAFPANIISQYDYTYDAMGRRVNVSQTGTAFAQNDSVAYCYNIRSELTNAVAAVDSSYLYAYGFDDIGNREVASGRGVNSIYAANSLNQYTMVGRGVPNAPQEEFMPQYDDDGNQTLIQTSTGIWSVIYNGENRPVLWSDGATNIVMQFDRMGRRVSYLETCGSATNSSKAFAYDGYLQIANCELATQNPQLFIWDPTEPVATRPLAFYRSNASPQYYTHDGNKNVSGIAGADQTVAAHYEYAPFGSVLSTSGASAASNPFRFSSEYADDALGLVYYNYRHYNPLDGRWIGRDIASAIAGLNNYAFVDNQILQRFDVVGAYGVSSGKGAIKIRYNGQYTCLDGVSGAFFINYMASLPDKSVTDIEFVGHGNFSGMYPFDSVKSYLGWSVYDNSLKLYYSLYDSENSETIHAENLSAILKKKLSRRAKVYFNGCHTASEDDEEYITPEMKNFVKGFSKEMHGVMVSGNKKYTLSNFGWLGGLSAFGFERAYLNGKEIGWPSTLLH